MVVGQGEEAVYNPLPVELGESLEEKDAKSEIHTRALKTCEVKVFLSHVGVSAISYRCVSLALN